MRQSDSISFDCNDSQHRDLPDPSGSPLIARRHDPQRTFFCIERLSVPFICKDYFTRGERRINLGKCKDDFVAVRCLHQQHFGQSWSPEFVAQLNTGT